MLAGPWLLALAGAAAGSAGTLASLGPLRLRADAFPSAVITLAALAQVVVLPLVALRTDRARAKQRVLLVCAALGALVAVGLAATSGDEWLAAGLAFFVGSVLWSVGDVAWNGMLPGLAAGGDYEAVSARGSAVGYVGGGLILALDLALLELRGVFGIGEATAVRICFLTGAAWWLVFCLPAARRLRHVERHPAERHPAERHRAEGGAGGAGPMAPLTSVRSQLRLVRSMPATARFLVAYLCFADAMSAVISLSSTFLTHQLFHDDATAASPFLFSLILAVQFVAMGGALAAARLANRYGPKLVLAANLVIWCLVIFFAWAVLDNLVEAVAMGLVIGVALGGTSTLSRSLFARMVPAGREAVFFSFYEVSSQGTSWIAPLIFTVVVDVTGSFRQAILSLVVLFVVGLVLLARVDPTRAAGEAAGVSFPSPTLAAD